MPSLTKKQQSTSFSCNEIPIPVIIHNKKDGTIIDLNVSAKKIFGSSIIQKKNHYIKDLLSTQLPNKKTKKEWIDLGVASYRASKGNELSMRVLRKAIRINGRDCYADFLKEIKHEGTTVKDSLIAASLDAIISVDSNGCIMEWNPAAEQIFGWKKREVIGKTMSDLIIPEKYREQHLRGMNRYRETGKGKILNQLIEISALNKNGDEFSVELTIVPVRENDVEIIYSFIRNIEERKKIEQGLKQSEFYLKRAQSVASVGSWEMSGRFQETYWSDEFYRIHGLEPQSIKPSTRLRLAMVYPKDRAKLEEAIEHAFVEGKPYAIEKRIVLPNKEVRWILSQGEATVDAITGKKKVFGTLLDITARKKAEEEQLAVKKRLQQTLRFSRMGTAELTIATGMLIVDEELFMLLEEDDTTSRSFPFLEFLERYILPEDIAYILDVVKEGALASSTKESDLLLEFRMKTAKGNILYIDAQGTFRSDGTALGILRDITQRRKTESESKTKSALIETMLYGITDGFFAIDRNLNFTLVNPVFAQLAQMKPEEMVEKNMIDLFPTMKGSSLVSMYHEAMRTGKSRTTESINLSNTQQVFQINIYPNAEGLFIYYKDVSKAKRYEEELILSNTTLSNLIDNLPGYVYRVSNNNIPLLISGQVEQVTGYRPDEYFANLIALREKEIHPADTKRVYDLIQQAIDKKENFSCEYRITTNKGEEKWVLEKGKAIFNPTGELSHLEGFVMDITDRKKADQEINKLALIASRTSNAVLVTDTEAKILWVNEGFEKISGYSLNEVIGRRPFEFLQGPETNMEALRNNVGHLAKGEGFRAEMLGYSKSRKKIWLDIEVLPVHDEQGQLTGFIGIESDITDLKKAITDLMDSKSQLQTMMDNAPMVVFMKDVEGHYTFFNQTYQQTINSKIETGYTDYDLFDKEFADECRLKDKQVLESGNSITFEHIVDDHEYFETKFPIRDQGGKIYAVGGISLNVTERNKLMQAIRLREEQLSGLTNNLPDGVVFQYVQKSTGETYFPLISQGIETITGHTVDTIKQNPKFIFEQIHPEESTQLSELLNQSFTNLTVFDFQYRLQSLSGEYRWLHTRARPIKKNDGSIVLDGITLDITDKRKLEENIRESEEHFRLLVRDINIGVLLLGTNSEIFLCNQAALDIMRLTDYQLLGKVSIDKPWGLIRENGFEFPINELPVTQAMKTKLPVRSVVIGTKNKKEISWLLADAIPRLDEHGNIKNIICTLNDITPLKLAEEMVRENQDRLRVISDNLPSVAIYQYEVASGEFNGKYKYYSSGVENITGIAADELLADPFLFENQIHPTDTEEKIKRIKEANINQLVFDQEYRFKHKRSSQWRWLRTRSQPTKLPDGRTLWNGMIIDTTEQREAQKSLQFTRFTIDHSADPIFWIRPDGSFADFNPAAHESLGYTYDEMFFMSVPEIDVNYTSEVWPHHWKELREKRSMTFSSRQRRKDGSEVDVEINANFIVFDNQEFNCAFIRDITERKKIENDLLASNFEKDSLIKEIHHRVKNNLQLISSILYIKATSLKQSEMKDFLNDTRQKIRSIALIHERLLQTEVANELDIADYLNKLILDLQMTNIRKDLVITFENNIEPEIINLDTAIYCGLIINELITNSIKHAFINRTQGIIRVILKKEEGKHLLIISDNGSSLPDSIVPGQTGSFGMQLIDIFVKQLNGKMEINRTGGTTFIISFNKFKT